MIYLKKFFPTLRCLQKSQLKDYNKIVSMKMKLPAREGFTLVELLVVITIIGIMFGVVITSSVAIQKNGRDVQRKSDLRNIQTAIQQYYADQNFYPSVLPAAGSSLTSGTGTSTKTYLKSIPSDPTGVKAYYYKAYISQANSADCDNASESKCFYYKLCANLENSGSGTDCVNYNYLLTPN